MGCEIQNFTHCFLSFIRGIEILQLGCAQRSQNFTNDSKKDTKEVAGGSFYHFGVARGIISKLSTCNPSYLVGIESLTLHINIDGLPLFGSCSVSLWPILSMIKELPDKPFVIGVYCGSSKPTSLNEYLFNLVQEIK